MSVSLGGIIFQGIQGNIQPPMPVFEKFTALGNDKPYIQRVRTESRESQVTLWRYSSSQSSIDTIVTNLKKILGVPSKITWDSNTPPYDVILMDFSISFRSGRAEGTTQFLLQVDATLVAI
jgi:hypothetical protein